MTKINTLWLPFFVVTGLIFLSSPAGAVQEEAKIFTTVTTGNQIIEKEDISGAREEAVADALQESVERTLSEMMSSELFAANLEFLFDYILPDTSKYIVNYRVLTAFEKSSQFIVAVKADIDTAAIEKILKKYEIISSRGEKPSVLLFISEKNETDILPKYWWGNNPLPYSSFAATAVEAHLKENGYTVFPAGDEKIDPGMHDIKFNAIYDNQAAVALGEAVGADMVVMGKATCTRISDDMVPAERYKTLISLDILNVKTAEKIGAINITRTAGDKTAPDEGTADTVTTDETAADAVIPGEEVPDETAADAPPEDTAAVMETDEDGRKAALEAAGKRAGEKVAAAMDRFWTKNVIKKHQTIEVKIEGTDYLSCFILLRKILNKMPDINNIQTKELGSEQAVVDIMFKGTAERLAEELVTKTFDSFDIEIFDVKEGALTIRFLPQNGDQPVNEKEMESVFISE